MLEISPATQKMIHEAERVSAQLGFSTLRPKQVEVLAHLAVRRPTFAALPTGYGKSLCAWLPALAWGWRVWILSPLISLIEDQALACAALGIPVVPWKGSQSRSLRNELQHQMLSGEARIAFLSPERLLLWQQSGFFDELVSRGRDADLYVLDEMHCLDEWRSFRIGYKNLAESLRRELLRGSVLLGLSASLALKEAETWMGELVGEEFFSIVNAGLGRENLNLCVLPLETEKERWLHLLSALRSLRSPETALVYCQSRNEADETARWLRSAGLEAIAYHAGLPAAERAERSRSFRAGRLRVVCATSAFGMGVDYPHVSRVIHFSMPRDLSSYWQEVGRAGRNGKNATAIAFWRRSEIVRARQMPLLEREAFFALWTAWAEGGCRKLAVAKHLGLEEKACGECDRCRDSGSWLYDPGSAWWTEKSANLKHWVNCRREEGI